MSVGAAERRSVKRPHRRFSTPIEYEVPTVNATFLWIIAAVLVVVGIVQLLQGQILLGVALIVGACLVGPGGYSVFTRR